MTGIPGVWSERGDVEHRRGRGAKGERGERGERERGSSIRRVAMAAGALVFVLGAPIAHASDFVTPTAGKITIELLGSDAAFSNTLSLIVPPGAPWGIVVSGCSLETANGLTGLQLVSEKAAVHGCRVVLDADVNTPGIQAFPANTALRFNMCAKVLVPGTTCDFIWSSDPTENSDHVDHVHTQIAGNHAQLSWEDETAAQSDNDFNDLIVNVRIDGDTDGDGLWDDWETNGIDFDGDGKIDLQLVGADPMHKDLFVQVDYMDCTVPGSDCAAGDTHSHQPKAEAMTAVTNFFATAPMPSVTNPDGTPGVRLHIVSNPIKHQNVVHMSDQCVAADPGSEIFDTIKQARFGVNDPHRVAFRYALWGHQQAAGSSVSGCAEFPGDDVMVSLGGWNTGGPDDIDGDGLSDRDVGTIQQQAGTFIHELGHNLGLHHGGGDGADHKPNYLSLMNHFFQMSGIPGGSPSGHLTAQLLFSTNTLPPLNETALDETAQMNLGSSLSFYYCPDGVNLGTIFSNFNIDWDCNGATNTITGPIDINFDRVCVDGGADGNLTTLAVAGDVPETLPTSPSPTSVISDGPNRTCETTSLPADRQVRPVGDVQPKILADFNDWANLQYSFQETSAFEQGVHTSRANTIEIDYPAFVRTVLADLALNIAGPPQATTGSQVTYTLTTRNLHPDQARQVLVEDVLPAGLSFVSCLATSGGVCGGSGADRTISFASLPGGGTVSASLTAQLSCALPDGATITDHAVVSALQGDSNASNNDAVTQLVVRNPAPVLSAATPSEATLWPPNHKLVDVAINYDVTDNCAGTTCSLSVTSSEPVNGTGDGDTAPDWIVVDDHHVKLRAERAGNGPGRTYTIGATCTDSGGAASTTSTTVRVPHDRR